MLINNVSASAVNPFKAAMEESTENDVEMKREALGGDQQAIRYLANEQLRQRLDKPPAAPNSAQIVDLMA
jgi:hypothetical protein